MIGCRWYSCYNYLALLQIISRSALHIQSPSFNRVHILPVNLHRYTGTGYIYPYKILPPWNSPENAFKKVREFDCVLGFGSSILLY